VLPSSTFISRRLPLGRQPGTWSRPPGVAAGHRSDA